MKLKTFTLSLLTINLLNATTISEIVESMKAFKAEQEANQKVIQAENEELIRQNSIYYENVIKASRAYYSKYIGDIWGKDNVVLSKKESFTQYSKDLKSRETIDFKNGKVILEVITDLKKSLSAKEFNQKLKELKDESIDEAKEKDPISKLSSGYLEKKNIITKWKPNREKLLDDMVEDVTLSDKDLKERVIDKDKKIVYVEVKMVPKHFEKRAKRYKNLVRENAKRFGVKLSYIFATIQTESYFNPLAKSYVPAYGLMQLVPTSGGMEAYYKLYGEKKLLSPAYLYNPANNIELGAKYIEVIQNQYLKGVKNRESLIYCTAIAYNAGIGNLYRVFSGSKSGRSKAIKVINSMSPNEVYKTLHTSNRLVAEARSYVKKIKDNRENYLIWDREV